MEDKLATLIPSILSITYFAGMILVKLFRIATLWVKLIIHVHLNVLESTVVTSHILAIGDSEYREQV